MKNKYKIMILGVVFVLVIFGLFKSQILNYQKLVQASIVDNEINQLVIDGSKKMVTDNLNNYEKNETINISIKELVEKGYLDLMKDPEGTGFCDGELSYVEIANTGRDYEYTACLYCGQYKTDKALCATYTLDNDDPVCGETVGEPTNGRWTNQNRTISVKCSDATTGCTRTSFAKTFTTTTKTSTISIVDKSGRKVDCPVNVYVDKTPPTCDLKVTGNYDEDLG